MSTLQEKYSGVINAARVGGIQHLSVREQDGILYVSGEAVDTKTKDMVWDALGLIDPSFSATDININIQVAGLVAGVNLTVATEQTNLNIRQEPSTEAQVIGKARKGELVTLVEQSSSDWWKIKTADGTEGYAYARYLKV